ncbi:kinectin [Tachyglossus aculeatus]|uniref:kinectin n=1 Tax=Tachyglossus aculeatus TaxID=9261 RepID=UPI0018F740E5|nr:kinectin [Tachyglossus aculeatus]
MELYESTYFLLLVPLAVITVLFLFFWLFMKETLYEEVLAKQKRDQKPLPPKADKKKPEKKRSRKKDPQNGGPNESDAETAPRDLRLSDALDGEAEPVAPAAPAAGEGPGGPRKRKEKKPKPGPEDRAPKEGDGARDAAKKTEPGPVTKQPTPPSEPVVPSKKRAGPKKPKNGSDDQDAKIEALLSAYATKKQDPLLFHQETKPESGSGKKKSAKKQKTDNTVVNEPVIQATTYIPLMDNSGLNPVGEKREVADLAKAEPPEGVPRTGSKKLKNETDKENAEVKFKDFLLALKNMKFSEEEAVSVLESLKEKSGAIQDALQKASKGSAAAALHQLHEKEKLLAAIREDAALVKEQCKKLTQELMTEKERGSLVLAKMRERIGTLEKEHGVFQNKIHAGYQEAQQMQMKFQQVREQMEAEITHLKQENGILRDAVSNTTNQLESKQASELNKLRRDYSRLLTELSDKTGTLQQEEIQKKNAEQALAQLKVKQQETERRWEEIQSYLRKRTAEHEAAQKDLQTKLVSKENEVQSLRGQLTEAMLSQQQLEQRLIQLMEAEQKRAKKEDSFQLQAQELLEQNETLKAQLQQCHTQMAAQTSASALAEELHKVIAEKDKKMKQAEDSLAIERSHLASKEEEFKVAQNMNYLLKAEVQKLKALTNEQASAAHELEKMQKSIHLKDDKIQALEEQLQGELLQVANKMEEFKILKDQNKALQVEVQKLRALVSEQVSKECVEQMERSIQEKDEKLKTVEELLETGLIQVANKEEELKALRTENATLKKDVERLRAQQTDQVALTSLNEELRRATREKDGKLKSAEELLQAEAQKAASKEKTIQALKQEVEALKEEVGKIQLEKAQQVSFTAQIRELESLLKGKEEQVKSAENVLEEREKELADHGKRLQALRDENASLKTHVQELAQKSSQQAAAALQIQELKCLLKSKDDAVKVVEAVLKERETDLADKGRLLQDVQDENQVFRSQIQELQQQNARQVSPAPSEDLLQVIAGKEKEISRLQNEIGALKNAVEQQRKKNNELREKNWKAMDALASTEKLLQDKANKTAKERQQQLEAAESQAKEVLQDLFPSVSLPSSLGFSEWLRGFEEKAKDRAAAGPDAEMIKAMEQKLKEAEENHALLQLDCEKYKSVLAETEGILKRLQLSVEEEESKWKVKVDDSQKALRQMKSSFSPLEQEVERLRGENKEVETLKREREHLETELEKAEIERSTYVSEVRELKDLLTELQKKLDDSYSEAIRQNEELNLLKTQLNETLLKLKTEQSERQKVAGDLYKAQQSLDLIQSKIVKAAGDTSVIENSDVSPEMEAMEKETTSVSLNQSVRQLQQLLQAVNQQLTKEREHYPVIE